MKNCTMPSALAHYKRTALQFRNIFICISFVLGSLQPLLSILIIPSFCPIQNALIFPYKRIYLVFVYISLKQPFYTLSTHGTLGTIIMLSFDLHIMNHILLHKMSDSEWKNTECRVLAAWVPRVHIPMEKTSLFLFWKLKREYSHIEYRNRFYNQL